MHTVKLIKKAYRGALRAFKAGDPANFAIQDNQDDTVSMFGVDQAGALVDISAVASLAVTSADPATLTVDAPTGSTFLMHGVKPGVNVVLHITATWNDGSVGPFSFDLPCDVTGSAVTGLKVVPGTPVARP